ncbi:Sec-independent protein translocase subunit TatA [Corynebacterium caspium]|uniref:Sec-independent protein translocase subunit TatA n=1 Tax=Corynebacterium caspium TaxID=234828 RepID=UPI00037B1FF3|nr:Sec-independent protein translocase subunit TatA [Corynebacterium caspium]WKD59305.1 Sec-independent protein translocase protein TatA [Corynebacterium caspium DSM 44850]
MGLPGGFELLIIAIVIVLLFGTKKLPDAARSVGRSMRIFRSEIKEMKNDDAPEELSAPAATATPVTPVDPAQPAASSNITNIEESKKQES